MSDDSVPRRQFLLRAGLAGTALATGLTEAAEAQQPAPHATPAPSAPDAEPYVNLTAVEAAFIVAAVDTLIPADELSPSGSDCGVAVFIDRQLGSAWGGGAKMYRAGPFREGQAGARLSARADTARVLRCRNCRRQRLDAQDLRPRSSIASLRPTASPH